MTREEAIDALKKRISPYTNCAADAEANEAIGMAIKALKKANVIDKIRVEIENHCGLTKENHCRYCSYCNILMGVREILEIIDKYKSESEGAHE